MPARAVTERISPPRAQGVVAPKFTGRERELAALAGALAATPAVVLVEGEAGIGKSRLVREYLASAAGRRAPALVATCPPFRQPHTLGPIADAVRQAAVGRVSSLKLSALAGALRPLFPDWADDLPPAPEPESDATAARHRVFTALAELLTALEVRVLVIEDVHWADEATVEFLLYLAAREPQPIDLLVTSRPEDVPEGALLLRLSRLAAGSSGLRLGLGPLDVAQTGHLVSSMLAGAPVSEQFAVFLHERTDGVPLAVEESVRLMGDRADLAVRHGTWARRHLPKIDVPPTVRDAVLERIARLSSDAVAVLRAAAVLAQPASGTVVQAVAGITDDGAQAGLCEALACSLLVENAPDGPGFLFRHELAARAVYDAIPAPLRREFHLRAGRALEAAPVLPSARLARHFREAGVDREWLRHGERAADLALATGDHGTAATLMHDLITRISLTAGDTVRLMRKIPMMALTGYAPVGELARSLRALCDRPELSATERAEVRGQFGRVLMNAGEFEEAEAELEQALPGLAHRPAEACRSMILLGRGVQTLWPASVHLKWLERGWAAAQDPMVSADDRFVAAVNRAGALLVLGEESGWVAATELLRDTSAAGQTLQSVRCLDTLGSASVMWGRFGDARQWYEASLQLADKHDYPRLRDRAIAGVAHLDWHTGAWEGLGERVTSLCQSEDPLIRQEALLIAGLREAAVSSSEAAEEKLWSPVNADPSHGDVDTFVEATAALARLRLDSGKFDDALAMTEYPMQILTAKGVWLWATDVALVRVHALSAMGRTEEAAAVVAAFARGVRGRNMPASRAALLSCRATLTEAQAEGQDVAAHTRAAAMYGRAAAAWQALPRPHDALLAQERQGYCLLACGQDQVAFDLLTLAYRGLSGLGAVRDARRVVKVLHDHGVKATAGRAGRRSYGNELSPRELEVVRLLVAGRTVREIAGDLFLSPKTVDCHVDSARRKLGAPSRIALAAAAVEAGIVSPRGQA